MNVHADIFQKLPKLTELIISTAVGINILTLIFGHVGHQLQKLGFTHTDEVHLDRVLDACPNLTELMIAPSIFYHSGLLIFGHGGHQLQKLGFTTYYSVNLKSVLDACPNLIELKMCAEYLDSTSELEPDTLSCLQTLSVECSRRAKDGLMMQVLQNAPKLRTLHLKKCDGS